MRRVMPAGWNQTSGTFREGPISEDTFWMLFNYVFSDSSAKRTTYKFGLIIFLTVRGRIILSSSAMKTYLESLQKITGTLLLSII